MKPMDDESLHQWLERHHLGMPYYEDPVLRFDGIYVSDSLIYCPENGLDSPGCDDSEQDCCYVRFYPDGQLVAATTSARTPNTTVVARWLNLDSDTVSRGKYYQKGEQLAFTTRTGLVAVDYFGLVHGGLLRVEEYSRHTRYLCNREYRFAQTNTTP